MVSSGIITDSTCLMTTLIVKPISAKSLVEYDESTHGNNELRLLFWGFCTKSSKAEQVSAAKLHSNLIQYNLTNLIYMVRSITNHGQNVYSRKNEEINTCQKPA